MAGKDNGIVRQVEQFVSDAVQLCLEVAAREVGSPDASLEQGVAAEKKLGIGDIIRGGARGMARCVNETDGGLSEAQLGTVV